MAKSNSSKGDACQQLASVFDDLAAAPNVRQQALLVAGWLENSTAPAPDLLRYVAHFWAAEVSRQWRDEDWTDRMLVDELWKEYCQRGRFAELLTAMQEMLVGDDRIDTIIADAVSRALLIEID